MVALSLCYYCFYLNFCLTQVIYFLMREKTYICYTRDNKHLPVEYPLTLWHYAWLSRRDKVYMCTDVIVHMLHVVLYWALLLNYSVQKKLLTILCLILRTTVQCVNPGIPL